MPGKILERRRHTFTSNLWTCLTDKMSQPRQAEQMRAERSAAGHLLNGESLPRPFSGLKVGTLTFGTGDLGHNYI